MIPWCRILSVVVSLGLLAGELQAEIVYSGVKAIGIIPNSAATSIDIDGDGTFDLSFSANHLATTDIPSSGSGGSVTVSPRAGIHFLGVRDGLSLNETVGALPSGFIISESPESPFLWDNILMNWPVPGTPRYGIASWSRSLESGWRGWRGVASAPDPVIGFKIVTGNEKKYGWIRLRFGIGNPYAIQIYDWAYNSDEGAPITARAGYTGAITPAPSGRWGNPIISLTGTNFGASLNGSKAIPPSSASFTGTASIRLDGILLTGKIDLSSAPSISNGILQYEVILQSPEREIVLLSPVPEPIPPIIALPVMPMPGSAPNIQEQLRTLSLGPVELSSDLETAVRAGKCHLLLKSVAGNIRGQVARILPGGSAEAEEEIAGEYSLLLQMAHQEQNSRALPLSAGHGRLNISPNRNVSLEVTLPVGAPLRWRGKLRQDNTISLHIPTSKTGNGSELNGTLALLRDGNEFVLSGDLKWKRRRNPDAPRYPQGFTTTVNVEGSRFRPYSNRGGTYQLSFEGGDLPTPVTFTVDAIESDMLVTDPISYTVFERRKTFTLQAPRNHPLQLSLDFDSLNGSFRGSFRHPSTSALVPFSGRFLSTSNVGQGSFRGKRQSGKVTIDGFARMGTGTAIGTPLLTSSITDPDVLVLSVSGLVPNSGANLALIFDTFSTPPDGIYEFRLIQTGTTSDIVFMGFTQREASFPFHPPAGFKGIRVYHALGKTEVLYSPEAQAIAAGN